MKTLVALAVGALALTAVGLVSAHPKTYVNATGDIIMVPTDCDGSLGVSQGGVCWPAGHVTFPATFSIDDEVTNPTSGFLQVGGMGIAAFCGTHTVTSLPAGNTFVFVDGPVFGNPNDSPCGTLSIATVGTVSH